jgi:phosphohistidine phosphatase
MTTPVDDPVRHLFIVRHGKAASDAPWGGGDRERPLTARGRRDAAALGRRLATEQPVLGLDGVRKPDLAICSAAVRARQTADLLIEAMGTRVPLDAYQSLYEADTDLVLQYLRELDELAQSALVVGHNPTMYRLAWELTTLPRPPEGKDDASSGHAELEAHGFPTCSVAVLALHVDAWEDVVHGCATLLGLFKPPY